MRLVSELALSSGHDVMSGKEFGQLLSTLDANIYGSPSAIQEGRINGLYGFRAVVKVDSLTKIAGNGIVDDAVAP